MSKDKIYFNKSSVLHWDTSIGVFYTFDLHNYNYSLYSANFNIISYLFMVEDLISL